MKASEMIASSQQPITGFQQPIIIIGLPKADINIPNNKCALFYPKVDLVVC